MDVSLRRRFEVAQANGWLRVVRSARWPHVAVPYALRLPLPLLTFAILGIMIATGILASHLGGRVTEGSAWSVKYALAGGLLFTQAWLAWQPARGIIRINNERHARDEQLLKLSQDDPLTGAFNRRYGLEFFPLPEPQIFGAATRVMSLRDGTKKMSKSDSSDMSRINLTDDADAIARKIQKAKTDPHPLPDDEAGLAGRPEAENLLGIYAALSDMTLANALAENAGKQFSGFKKDLAERAVAVLAPITRRMRELTGDPTEIDAILRRGAEKAEALSAPVLAEVKRIVGFLKL